MATIRQRSPGVWEVRQYTGLGADGRSTQISRTVRGTKKDAKRMAATLTIAPPTRAASHTVAEMLDAWIAQSDPTWAESSRRDQRNRAELVRSDRLAKAKLSKLSVADIERWHSRLRKAGVGEGSIRNRHQALRAALTLAQRWGWVTVNVAAVARLSTPRRSVRSSMTDDDVRQVLIAARQVEPHAELALRIAAVTGARRSELAALRWDELDGARLTIDSSVSVIRTDGQKRVLVDAETKTGNRRVVTLDPQTVALAEELRAVSGEYATWMFTLDDEPAHPDRIGHWWRRARKASGIDKGWRLHDLRHWSATMAIASGHDIRTVANRLGHSNPAMTLRVYAHALDASDRGVSETIGRLLTTTPTPISELRMFEVRASGRLRRRVNPTSGGSRGASDPENLDTPSVLVVTRLGSKTWLAPRGILHFAGARSCLVGGASFLGGRDLESPRGVSRMYFVRRSPC